MVRVARSNRRGASRASTFSSIGRDSSGFAAGARPGTATSRATRQAQRAIRGAGMAASIIGEERPDDYASPADMAASAISAEFDLRILAVVEAFEEVPDRVRQRHRKPSPF